MTDLERRPSRGFPWVKALLGCAGVVLLLIIVGGFWLYNAIDKALLRDPVELAAVIAEIAPGAEIPAGYEGFGGIDLFGFKGVMIGTQPDAAGGVLDAPDLDPFWRTAHESGAIVYIHPVFESGDDRLGDYGMANAVGRITDTLIAFSRIIFSGHVARYNGACSSTDGSEKTKAHLYLTLGATSDGSRTWILITALRTRTLGHD